MSAFASSERTVVVDAGSVEDPPRQLSEIGDGDALNPNSWTVLGPDGSDLHVMSVRSIDATNFELYTLYKFAPSLFEHSVASSGLVDFGGFPVTPVAAEFLGCKFSSLAEPGDTLLDLSSPDLVGGLTVGSGGDFTNEGEVALLRKLVIRRLVTLRGGFFHLPNYGIGLRLKEPLPLSDLAALRVEIEREVGREPELEDVFVRLSLGMDGVLDVEVRATHVLTGRSVSASVVTTPGGVQL